MKIVAVVVTYNRKELLLECIQAILNQTYKLEKVIVIDNNSNDGTYECLKDNNILKKELIEYKKLDKNIGGAGGFYEGMKHSLDYNFDWLWIMDDDTIPKANCLENLVNSLGFIEGKVSYLASTVYGMSGEFMNVPLINTSPSDSGYPDWYKYLNNGIVKIKEATFVSLLINSDAIKKVGLPIKDYFIWGDDTEYTLRLNKYYGSSYLVGNSVVIHKRKIAKNLTLKEEENCNRLKFHYYMVRNNLINQNTYYGLQKMLIFLIKKQLESFEILFSLKSKNRIKKFLTIHKGIFAYLLRKYDYKAFKNRLDVNVKYKG